MGAKFIRIHDVIPESIVDGIGLRFVIFTQGCHHKCPGCHNPQTHDPEEGYTIDTDTLYQQIIKNPLLRGVTFSGGEPFLQPEPLIELAEKLKEHNLDVTIYTGFTYNHLTTKGTPQQKHLMTLTDMLIDGPFLIEKRDPSLLFRGSINQQILCLKDGHATKMAG